jgi:Bacteriocin-protection, YdeI or OmpD-Associated/Domain of unknown function (DUF1905)
MTLKHQEFEFKAKIARRAACSARLIRPEKAGSDAPLAFVVLPKNASANLTRRGRTSVEVVINAHGFSAMLEPDGQLSHWLALDQVLLQAAGANIGDIVTLKMRQLEQEPEPEIPADFQTALTAAPSAQATWENASTTARVDWIHWITSAKQSKTRVQRINNACDMLASGKRRVCCFDPSGYYSKAFSAPRAAS